MADSTGHPICQRIRQLRTELYGPRGKAAFARQLGLAASTYDYYEADRVPPAEILLQVSDVAGVDLRWLITGQTVGPASLPPSHPVLQRAAKLLAEHPEADKPLAAFLDILRGTLAFPEPKLDIALPATPIPPAVPAGDASSPEGTDGWIPVLGRSAAGVPHLWADPAQAEGLTTLADRVADNVPPASCSVASIQAAADVPDRQVQLVTLRQPPEGFNVEEFVVSTSLRGRYPRAFAVRIDGPSMQPEICHGDLVVLSPDEPARPGMPAVVQVTGAIGVTCKLYHPQGRMVHLVPINDQVPPTSVKLDQVEWALRVLCCIRP